MPAWPFALVALVVPLAAAHAEELVRGPAEVPLEVEVLSRTNETVSYRITNRGPHPVRHVEVLLSHAFRWDHEFAPGAENPSRAAIEPVPVVLAPGESQQVTSPIRPPLPARGDGRFETEVEVLRWTAVLPRQGELPGGARSTRSGLQTGDR